MCLDFQGMKAGQATLKFKLMQAEESNREARSQIQDLEEEMISLNEELAGLQEERDQYKVCKHKGWNVIEYCLVLEYRALWRAGEEKLIEVVQDSLFGKGNEKVPLFERRPCWWARS